MSRERRTAFTLLELMIAIGLASMLLIIAYSGFRATTQAMRMSNRMTIRNNLLSSYFAYACDLADNWRVMDPVAPDAAGVRNFRVERDGASRTGVDLTLPPSWPQPQLSLSTTRPSGPRYLMYGIDCAQLPLTQNALSAMITGSTPFPFTPFGRDRPNVDASQYKLRTFMDGVSSPNLYKTAWFGAGDSSTGVNGGWDGKGIGRKQTRRRANTCIIDLTDPESGVIQTLSFQLVAAEQWK